jgi:hypothetical protein
MARTCDNCRRPVFDTDTVCWHCGWKLPIPAQSEPETSSAAQNLAEADSSSASDPVAWPVVFFYGVLTAVTFLALVLLMRSLGLSPTIALKTDSGSGERILLNDPQKLFAVEIPADWTWYFQHGAQSQTSLASLVEEDARIQKAVAPLGDIVPDIDYLLFAENEFEFLVVTRSERLNRLTAQQAVISLRQELFENITVTEARLTQDKAAGDTAVFVLQRTDQPLYCWQSFSPGPSATYLVAACTPSENQNLFNPELNTVINSFTILSR